ncbi:MAG: class I SAM-dependent methyltransferase [Actinomycetota bacterium]
MSGGSNEDLPDHVAENQRHWDAMAGQWVGPGERAWASEPSWGLWQVPESELALLPDDMTGMDAIELGCGTAYISAWMARRGATVTAVDTSAEQLATASRLMGEHELELTLVHANAETVPAPDASFDFAINEYGAAIWCEPETWLREAHRLLRPGGRLVFLANHPMAITCAPLDGAPVGDRLARSYFDLHTIDWREVEIDPGGVNFALPISGWVSLFNEIGFAIDDIHEPQAADGAQTFDGFIEAEWASAWPSEIVFSLTRR